MESRASALHPDRPELVGAQYAFANPIATMQGDLNISAFGAAWSRRHLLNEASGYDLGAPTAEDDKLASQYCAGTAHWPDPSSITVIEELAIVCL